VPPRSPGLTGPIARISLSFIGAQETVEFPQISCGCRILVDKPDTLIRVSRQLSRTGKDPLSGGWTG
jgi:hypothetical protein